MKKMRKKKRKNQKKIKKKKKKKEKKVNLQLIKILNYIRINALIKLKENMKKKNIK